MNKPQRMPFSTKVSKVQYLETAAGLAAAIIIILSGDDSVPVLVRLLFLTYIAINLGFIILLVNILLKGD